MIENEPEETSAEHQSVERQLLGAVFNPAGASLKTEFMSSVMRATYLTEGGLTMCEEPMSLSRRLSTPNETDYLMLKTLARNRQKYPLTGSTVPRARCVQQDQDPCWHGPRWMCVDPTQHDGFASDSLQALCEAHQQYPVNDFVAQRHGGEVGTGEKNAGRIGRAKLDEGLGSLGGALRQRQR